MAKRFLLVGWDAADWKYLNPLMDSGAMPALNRIVETGVVGDLLACQPLNAAAQWTSLATGKRPWQHGITLPREFDSVRQQPVPISRPHRHTSAIWEMLAARGKRGVVVGWPATHNSQPDLVSIVSDRYSEPTAPPGVKPWPPAPAGTYWPDPLRESLDALRVSPEAIGADVISRYIPNWKKIDQQRDQRIGRLRVLLAVDFSHFAATTTLLQSQDWEFAAVRFPALGHLARMFLPFQPPRRDWIGEAEFDLYHNVMQVECRTLDQTLASICNMAGPDTAILLVSPHGTRTPDIPPAGFPQNDADGWKSPYGIFAAAGPEFARDRLLHGASVLDIAPTLLAWFGLPIGDDMEGRVLVEGFTNISEIQHLQTWDSTSHAAAPSAPQEPAASPVEEGLRCESRWNFVQSCLEAGRLEEALPHLEELFRAFPERADFSHALFQCQLNLGRLDQAEETLEVLVENLPPGPPAQLPRAELALAKRDLRQVRSLVEELSRANLTHPALLRRLGILLLRLREWKALAELARAALKHEENDPIAWLGLAEASLRQQKPAEAEDAARHAIQLKYFLPDAHFILARSLVAQNKWAEAREAMSALVKLQPNNKAATGYNRRLAQDQRQ